MQSGRPCWPQQRVSLVLDRHRSAWLPRAGGVVTVGGMLNSIARDQLKCHNCVALGHFARDCPLPLVQRGVGLNVVRVQEEQHENELIAALRGQVDLQHQLLATQEGSIQQNDVKVAELAARVGFMGGTGASASTWRSWDRRLREHRR